MEVLRRNFTPDLYVELIDYYPRLKDWYLTAEPETYQWLIDHVENNWTVFEVGAHVGEASILLSHLCSRVISFEANKKTAEMFRNNIEHNQFIGNGELLNIELVVRPVGQYDGIVSEKLWLTGKDDKFGETDGEFNFLSLSNFARRRDDINWVSLIFIDADGWDYDIVLGSDFIINRCKPYIIMEANYALGWRGHSMDKIRSWADFYDYDLQFLDANCPGNLLLIPDVEKL